MIIVFRLTCIEQNANPILLLCYKDRNNNYDLPSVNIIFYDVAIRNIDYYYDISDFQYTSNAVLIYYYYIMHYYYFYYSAYENLPEKNLQLIKYNNIIKYDTRYT